MPLCFFIIDFLQYKQTKRNSIPQHDVHLIYQETAIIEIHSFVIPHDKSQFINCEFHLRARWLFPFLNNLLVLGEGNRFVLVEVHVDYTRSVVVKNLLLLFTRGRHGVVTIHLGDAIGSFGGVVEDFLD